MWLLPAGMLLLWLGYRQVAACYARPQVVLVLGGAEEREREAAQLARSHPEVKVWVSSGSPRWYVEEIFANAGVQRSRLYLDYRAQDTVTNFTTLVDDLKTQGVKSVYLVTSEDHMLRARAIAEIVLGSRGILVKPVAVAGERPPEPWTKSVRDGMRALLWVTTGKTGAGWKERAFLLKPHSSEVLAPERKVER